ncbi:uncharacterized protein LOC129582358 [Paramacrobiotus metropolitanus]|uniref:uncharacterized protein LOC129582358 n=1 Tax=Paramacrobiotus metropolitanus TaxID=2943436 RepID=UPI0024456E84|nr:uncharacterized protein LOC129582358 [Paramacrobiotus metropolitanus]
MSIARSPSQHLNEKQSEKLSFSDTNPPSHRTNDGRVSLGHKSSVEDNALAGRFSGGYAALQVGSIAEDLVKAFLDANRRVLLKPNGKQLLDKCEGYRVDVFALLGNRLPYLAALWAAASMREAETLLAHICAGFQLPLVTMHRKLGSAKNMTREHHRAYLETLNVESLLQNTRATMNWYAAKSPVFSYHWLVEWLKVLRILFPSNAGYVVISGRTEFEPRIQLDYGAVLTADPHPKVVLIVKGSLCGWPGYLRTGEHQQEWDLFILSKKMRDQGVACFPERMFWLCFRGVHGGVGWQEGEAFPQRLWPGHYDLYHDVRRVDSVRVLCSFVQLIVDRMMQLDERVLRSLPCIVRSKPSSSVLSM